MRGFRKMGHRFTSLGAAVMAVFLMAWGWWAPVAPAAAKTPPAAPRG